MEVSIGDKVELKCDGELYIVEAMAGRDKFSIRKYYQEETKQIDVTRDEIKTIVTLNSNEPLQNDENYNDESTITPKREMESTSQFSKFLKKFFNIPSEILYDPIYFSFIPNMTIFMIWVFSISLLLMSSVTVLFCLCPLVFNSFWLKFWQSLLFFFLTGLPSSCANWRAMRHHLKYKQSFRDRLVQLLFPTIIVTISLMTLQLFSDLMTLKQLFSQWALAVSCGTFLLLLPNQPLMEYFLNSVLANNTDFQNDENIKNRNRRVMIMDKLLLLSQYLLIPLWIWGSTKTFHVRDDHAGSLLITFFLLKIAKHGFLQLNYVVVSYIPNQPEVFRATQPRFIFSAVLLKILVLSNVTLNQCFVFVIFGIIFDFCETLYHAKAFNNKRDPILKMFGFVDNPQSFEISIQTRFSYICATTIAEIIAPLYFYIAILIFQTSGLSEQIWFLGVDKMLTSSFAGAMMMLILGAMTNAFMMCQTLKMLSQNNICLTHHLIYLMENDFEILFLTPLVLVGYLLTICSFFGAVSA